MNNNKNTVIIRFVDNKPEYLVETEQGYRYWVNNIYYATRFEAMEDILLNTLNEVRKSLPNIKVIANIVPDVLFGAKY